MATLIALLSSGKGSWAQVNSLIKAHDWEKVYLLCNDFSFEKYEADPAKSVKVRFDERKLEESVKKLSEFFKKEIKDMEVGVNLSSGTGMEHMAVVSSVLRAGLGIRFVYADNNELKEFNIFDMKFEEEEDELY